MQQENEAPMLQNIKFMDNLQEQIQTKLDEQQISIKELERKAGLKVSAVQNILSGRSSNPKIETIIAISKILDCSLDDLIGATKAQSSSPNKAEEHTTEAKIAWNYELYQECAKGVENYIKSKNLKSTAMPNSELILFLIKEAYVYSTEGGKDKADLQFIKWIVDSHCR